MKIKRPLITFAAFIIPATNLLAQTVGTLAPPVPQDNETFAITADTSNRYYITCAAEATVRRFNTGTSSFDAVPWVGAGTLRGNATSASPSGIAYSNGYIYVADEARHVLWRFPVTSGESGGVVIAGSLDVVGSADGSFSNGASSARLYGPKNLSVNGAGEIIIADRQNGKIRKLDSMNVVSTIKDGLSNPVHAVSGSDGSLYIADSQGIKLLTPNGTLTLIRSESSIRSLVISKPDTMLFCGENANYPELKKLYKYSGNWLVESVAGGSATGYADGSAMNARFQSINCITFDNYGSILITDFGSAASPGGKIRTFMPVVPGPPTIVPAGATLQNNSITVTLSIGSGDAAIYWTIDGSECSPKNPAANLYTGPFALATTGILRARAHITERVHSSTASGSFSFKAAAPQIQWASAPGPNTQITLSSATTGANIYWTIDGKNPSDVSSQRQRYSGPFTTGSSGTLRAQAFNRGFIESDVSTAVVP